MVNAFQHQKTCFWLCGVRGASRKEVDHLPLFQARDVLPRLPYPRFPARLFSQREGKREPNMTSNPSKQPSAHVTAAHAAAQLDAQAGRRRAAEEAATKAKQTKGKDKQASLLPKRRAGTTMERAIADYLLDHEGGNSSQKTLQWHQTALGLLRSFLQDERGITLVGEVDAPNINAWFASMRKTPSSRGKIRSERTIQTSARSARCTGYLGHPFGNLTT